MKQIIKFGVKDQVGYVCGDMAGSFVNLYVDAYFLIFCTNILGIEPSFMGTLFLFARLWDAFNDPLIGSLPDRFTIGKSGDKFKPYIKIAMVPLAISGLLCFSDISSFDSTFKHIFVCVSYIIYGMSYTGTSMPFGSMAAVVTNDPVERTKLSRARAIGGTIVGTIALAVIPLFIFDDNDEMIASGFFKIAVIFGALSIIFYIALLKLTQERIRQTPKENEKFNYMEILKSVAKNRPLIGVMVATVGSLLFITGNGQLNSYLFKEYYAQPKLLTTVTLLTLPVMVICFPLIPKLSARFGKRNLILFCATYNFIISTFLFLVPIQNVWVYIIINLIANSGQTVFMMLIWAFVTDCIDYNEYLTGNRSDGSLYSIYTFSRKIGSTLASTIASYSLATIGFVAGASSQSVEVASNIRYLCTGIPVITCILQLIGIGLIYNLTKQKTEEIYSKLKVMRKEKGE